MNHTESESSNHDKKSTKSVGGERIRIHVRFTGRVQGVGFRYKASYVARARNITGWITNHMDGSVEMEAQGSAGAVHKMLEILNQDRFIRIEGMESRDMSVVEREHGFCIKG